MKKKCSMVWFINPKHISCKLFDNPYCNCPGEYEKDCVELGKECKFEKKRGD